MVDVSTYVVLFDGVVIPNEEVHTSGIYGQSIHKDAQDEEIKQEGELNDYSYHLYSNFPAQWCKSAFVESSADTVAAQLHTENKSIQTTDYKQTLTLSSCSKADSEEYWCRVDPTAFILTDIDYIRAKCKWYFQNVTDFENNPRIVEHMKYLDLFTQCFTIKLLENSLAGYGDEELLYYNHYHPNKFAREKESTYRNNEFSLRVIQNVPEKDNCIPFVPDADYNTNLTADRKDYSSLLKLNSAQHQPNIYFGDNSFIQEEVLAKISYDKYSLLDFQQDTTNELNAATGDYCSSSGNRISKNPSSARPNTPPAMLKSRTFVKTNCNVQFPKQEEGATHLKVQESIFQNNPRCKVNDCEKNEHITQLSDYDFCQAKRKKNEKMKLEKNQPNKPKNDGNSSCTDNKCRSNSFWPNTSKKSSSHLSDSDRKHVQHIYDNLNNITKTSDSEYISQTKTFDKKDNLKREPRYVNLCRVEQKDCNPLRINQGNTRKNWSDSFTTVLINSFIQNLKSKDNDNSVTTTTYEDKDTLESPSENPTTLNSSLNKADATKANKNCRSEITPASSVYGYKEDEKLCFTQNLDYDQRNLSDDSKVNDRLRRLASDPERFTSSEITRTDSVRNNPFRKSQRKPLRNEFNNDDGCSTISENLYHYLDFSSEGSQYGTKNDLMTSVSDVEYTDINCSEPCSSIPSGMSSFSVKKKYHKRKKRKRRRCRECMKDDCCKLSEMRVFKDRGVRSSSSQNDYVTCWKRFCVIL